MSKFTAQDAREIVTTKSYSTRGYVIDQIKKAAANDQHSITISDLKLKPGIEQQFISDGFTIKGKTISWEVID